MATPQEHASGLLSASQFEEFVRTLVSEIRKPPVDPIKEIQRKRERETKDAANRTMWETRLARLRRCAHSRQDGTCIIGWARQSDGVERGFCPNCSDLSAGLIIGPELAQLFPEHAEEMKELYRKQRERPRGLMENVRYVQG
jgi:hypothetical protein